MKIILYYLKQFVLFCLKNMRTVVQKYRATKVTNCKPTVCCACDVALNASNKWVSFVRSRGRPTQKPICMPCKDIISAYDLQNCRSSNILSKRKTMQSTLFVKKTASSDNDSDDDATQSVKRAKIDGRPYDKKINPHKEKFNDIAATMIQVAHREKFGNGDRIPSIEQLNAEDELTRCIVLDGCDNRTSKALINAGIAKHCIESIECESVVQDAHRRFGIKCHPCLFEEFVTIPTQTPVLAFIADACRSVKNVANPVLSAIKNGYFTKGSILAVTMSRRVGKGKTFNEEYDLWLHALRHTAIQHGLTVEDTKYGWSYGAPRRQQGLMHSDFFIFR